PPQETMQKLTWLASERRLSQEADSEEENSQEDNSEPDDEEEEGDGLDLKGADGLLQEMADKEGRTLGFPTVRDQIRAGGCLP
ncbi:hypothetical protein chiPu_0027501, partial [Chiloscyllium punctatum]|nr:hypothetical protein [Chiloscyllium punctatum]